MEEKDKRISQLPIAAELDGSEVVPFAKSGGNGSLLVSLLKQYIRSGLATKDEVTVLQNTLTQNYATKSEIPDVSVFPTVAQYNAVLQEVQTLRTEVQRLSSIVSGYPEIPLHDGKCYAIVNGQWVEIAGLNEDILVAKADIE